jgi:hypothetical protein
LNPLWRHPNLNADRAFDLEQVARGDSQGQQGLIETFGSSFWIRMKG